MRKKVLYLLLLFVLMFAGVYYCEIDNPVSVVAATDEYVARDPYYSLTDSSVHRMSSEHFQIIWGNEDTTGTVNEEFVRGNLINLETIRSFYMDELKFADLGISPNKAITGKYKTNVYIAATGLSKIGDDWAYMTVDQDAFAYLVMAPGAMRVDPPSWVVPHELAHAFTYHMGGVVPYEWYEAVANFCRNEYLQSSYNKYGENVYGPETDFFAPFLLNAESHFPHTKNWYDVWPIFLYIEENPDQISGLGHDAILKILKNNQEDETFFHTIERLTGVEIEKILGGFERRLVTMDFDAQSHYQKSLNDLLEQDYLNYGKIYTTLEKSSDGWMSVPDSKAPQQGGYNIIPLDVDLKKDLIKVEFQGLSSVSGAGWRISIVTVTKTGETRYSTMWNGGSNSMELKGDETAAYLVVSATPSSMTKLELDRDGEKYPYKVLYLSEQNTLGSLERSAEVKASYCSEWEKKTAVNDGETGSTSLGSDCSHWGTWGNMEATEEWISYEWSTPVCIDTSQVYFFDDGAGVQVPSSYRYEYLNENGKWTEIPNQQGLETKKDQYNVTTFDAVVTKGIRAVLVKQADGVGINEWKVSGKPVPDQNNLSESADIKVSYCSGWEKETAVNDGETGSASLGSDCSHWGTWGNNEATEEWISYEWAVPVYIDRSEIYFFDNSNGGDGGVQVPSSYRYEYLNENGEWTEMPNQQGLETKQDQYNVTTFDTVKTKGIRAILVKQADGVGINEWKVSGKAVTEPAAEKGVLKAAIDAEVNAEDTYTAESWKVYADALAGAKEIYNRKDASQAEVDAAADALTEAVKALTRKPERPFVDVEAGSWYYDAVYYNYDRMIIAGMDETHFEPETKLTRAQFAIMLHRMNGKPETVYEARFSDVTEGAWYADAVMWASENGIITGYADGSRRFGPEDNINREQVAVMMYRYAKSQGYDVSVTADYSTYADAASVNIYAKEAVGWAVGEGILTGKEMGTRIDPQGSATRAECAVMFQRLMEKLLKK